ncbi:MAG: AraC family transcriptional regulator [Gammaproteobacteria bacterium]|jgi:AraC-like DNA-binding protein|nr:AraC family transcriptional regulator [Gammaproteobacteria bacterium]
MPISSHFSALSSWVLLIARAIDSYGCDSKELFARAGLDHAKLRDPLARFPAAAVLKLWPIAVETTQDPGFGLTVASFWHPTTLHALGYSWLASNNLEEAFDCAVRYTRIVNTAAQGVVAVETSADSYRVIINSVKFNPNPNDASVDAVLAMLLIMCRAAYGGNFKLQQVTFQHDAPASHRRFDDLFQAPVLFSQPENMLLIDPEIIREPLATANPELVRINDRVVTDYLAQLDHGDLGMRVRSKLIEHLPGGHISEADIASSINVSQRSLQRKLREQGMSFTQLVESTRRELGLQYVRDPQYSFNEVAFLLGFTEPANFSRAFKRWYDKSPSQFRQDSLS